MNQEDYQAAIDQLAGAADLVAAGVPPEQRMMASHMRAFFGMRQRRPHETTAPRTSNDELFRDTAKAALEMAGRHEFIAAAALLEQAQSLLAD
jgi:hypothetical protein